MDVVADRDRAAGARAAGVHRVRIGGDVDGALVDVTLDDGPNATSLSALDRDPARGGGHVGVDVDVAGIAAGGRQVHLAAPEGDVLADRDRTAIGVMSTPTAVIPSTIPTEPTVSASASSTMSEPAALGGEDRDAGVGLTLPR